MKFIVTFLISAFLLSCNNAKEEAIEIHKNIEYQLQTVIKDVFILDKYLNLGENIKFNFSDKSENGIYSGILEIKVSHNRDNGEIEYSSFIEYEYDKNKAQSLKYKQGKFLCKIYSKDDGLKKEIYSSEFYDNEKWKCEISNTYFYFNEDIKYCINESNKKIGQSKLIRNNAIKKRNEANSILSSNAQAYYSALALEACRLFQESTALANKAYELRIKSDKMKQEYLDSFKETTKR